MEHSRPVSEGRERTPTPGLALRAERRSNLKGVEAFVEAVLLPLHPRLPDWFKEHWDEFCDGSRPVFTVKEGETIHGVLIGRIDTRLDVKISMIVAPGQNLVNLIRSALLSHFEQDAIRHGKTTAHMEIYADDRAEHDFLDCHGYLRKGPDWYHKTEFPDKPRLRMIKRPLI